MKKSHEGVRLQKEMTTAQQLIIKINANYNKSLEIRPNVMFQFTLFPALHSIHFKELFLEWANLNYTLTRSLLSIPQPAVTRPTGHL